MKYASPPLIEAVFEVYFVEPIEWTEATQASIESVLRPDYVGLREALRPVGMVFEMGPEMQLRGLQRREEPSRIRLWTPDKGHMVQFAPNMCAMNVLNAYSHYVDYEPALHQLVQSYLDEVAPPATALIGQRYINKVLLPPGGEPKDFFEIYPSMPESVGRRNPPFSMQLEVSTFSEGGNVVLTLTAQGEEEGQPVYMLDVYARQQGVGQPTWGEIKRVQDEAHVAVKAAFEMAITDRARNLFRRST